MTPPPDPKTTGEEGISEAASETGLALRVNAGVVDILAGALASLTPRESPEARAKREAWQSKTGPKRGRPRRFAREGDNPHKPIEEHHQELGSFQTNAKTGRGRQEAAYANSAMWTLFKHRHQHPEVIELTGFSAHDGGREYPACDGRKRTILAELGRLIWTYRNGEEVAVRLAVELARMEPELTTKQAAAWVRQHRLAKPTPGSVLGLVEVMGKAIDQYLASHSEMPTEKVTDALEYLLWLFSEDDDHSRGEPDRGVKLG